MADLNVSAPIVAPAAVKAAKAAPKRAPAAPKGKPVLFTADKSKTMWIRMLVCREPGIDNDKLDVLLKAGGLVINPSTIATIANDVRATIKAAIDCGKWAS
jgi:hypothetical protein